MALQIINIYIFSHMRGVKSTTPKCIFVLEDDDTKETRAYLRRFTDAMTNNQLALAAIIAALAKVTKRCEIHLHTDSAYVSGTFADNRLDAWRQQSWMNAKGTPVMNRSLWEKILELSAPHILCVEFNDSNSIYLWMKEQMKNVDNR